MPWGGEASWFQKPVVTAELPHSLSGGAVEPRPGLEPRLVWGLIWIYLSQVKLVYFKLSFIKTETCYSPEVSHLPNVCLGTECVVKAQKGQS